MRNLFKLSTVGALVFFLTSCSSDKNTVFAKRKYTKGHYVEATAKVTKPQSHVKENITINEGSDKNKVGNDELFVKKESSSSMIRKESLKKEGAITQKKKKSNRLSPIVREIAKGNFFNAHKEVLKDKNRTNKESNLYKSDDGDLAGILSLIFGILGLCLIPILGGILAIVFGNKAIRNNDSTLGHIGKVLGIISLILVAVALLILLLVVVAFGAAMSI